MKLKERMELYIEEMKKNGESINDIIKQVENSFDETIDDLILRFQNFINKKIWVLINYLIC